MEHLAQQMKHVVAATLVPLSNDGKKMMDIASLEEEAKASALKQVSTMFSKPEHMERLDRQRKTYMRKKMSVETIAKAEIDRQIEDIRRGLSQLDEALEDVEVIQKR